MSIYDYNLNLANNNLLPPSKRKPTNLALLGVTGDILQRYHGLFFIDYASGANYNDWVSGNPYSYTNRVRDIDNAIYELTTIGGISGVLPNPKDDPDNWIKVINVFVGSRERANYTSQKMVIEYALNRIFKLGPTALPWGGPSTTTQIYITNSQAVQSNFWLANSANALNISYLSNISAFQSYFLGNSYTYLGYDFTIYVPAALWTTLGATDTIREGVIRAQGDKYTQSGKVYRVLQY